MLKLISLTMKLDFLILLCLSCLFTGCDNLVELEDTKSNDVSNQTTIRNPSTAAKIALLAKGMGKDTRGCLHTSVKSVQPVMGSITRSSVDTVLYAVNFENEDGFALVAAKNDVEPLLALIDEGSFDSEENMKNYDFQSILYKTLLYASRPSPALASYTTPTPTLQPGYYDTIMPKTRREPLVKVKWGQSWPEGMFCPNKIAGCGPVAALQILSAMELPQSITYTFPEKDISTENIDWSELKKHVKSGPWENFCVVFNDCSLSKNGHRSLGRIARQIGYDANANYLQNGTETVSNSVTDVITRLTGKNVWRQGNSALTLYNYMYDLGSSNIVAYVRGDDCSEESAGGHAWVADGVWQVGLIIYFWGEGAVVDPSQPPTMVRTQVQDCSRYLHFNWGYNGNCNGYFLVNVFEMDKGYEYDERVNSPMNNNFAENFYFRTFRVK